MGILSRVAPVSPKTILADWRREVKYNNIDEFWKATERNMKQLLKGLLEKTMEEEVVVYTSTEWNQRCRVRIDYRNGYRYRDLLTTYGNIHLQIPRLRRERFRTKVFANYQRGLEGKNLRLITVDGQKGLLSALDEVYPFVPGQRCWAHKLRNVVSYLPRKRKKECSSEAAAIYEDKSKQSAINQFKIWKRKWVKVSKEAVKCLEKDMEYMLRFFDFPKDHRKKIRTTNVIERTFREVRRRVRTMSCFSNADSCNRIIFAIFNHMNKHWKEHPFKKFNQLEKTQL